MNNNKKNFLRKYLSKEMIKRIVIVVVVLLVGFGLGKIINTDGKSIKLGFEDIGELATQAAYCTNVERIDQSRDLFGIIIPFTQSKYIYSYDYVIKAGIDFSEVEWTVSEKSKEIKIMLPGVTILSNEVDLDSFKVYHEAESIFTQVTLTDNNNALKEMKQKAEDSAVKNGLLENAEENAKIILTSFMEQEYNLEEYKIKFVEK